MWSGEIISRYNLDTRRVLMRGVKEVTFLLRRCILSSRLWRTTLALGNDALEEDLEGSFEAPTSGHIPGSKRVYYPSMCHASRPLTSSQHAKPKGELNRSISAACGFISFGVVTLSEIKAKQSIPWCDNGVVAVIWIRCNNHFSPRVPNSPHPSSLNHYHQV